MWPQQGSKHIEVAHFPPLSPPLARQGGSLETFVFQSFDVVGEYEGVEFDDDEYNHDDQEVMKQTMLSEISPGHKSIKSNIIARQRKKRNFNGNQIA